MIYNLRGNFAGPPLHPASHGVLCCLIGFVLDFVVVLDLVLGYLHRGTEKLCEFKSLEQALP